MLGPKPHEVTADYPSPESMVTAPRLVKHQAPEMNERFIARATQTPFAPRSPSYGDERLFPAQSGALSGGRRSWKTEECSGTAVIDLMRSIAKREVTFFNGTVAIRRL